MTQSHSLQAGLIAIPLILISRKLPTIGKLPERLIRPPRRHSTRRARPPRKNKRVICTKTGVMSSARVPPACSAIDHGIAASLGVISVSEIVDEGHHLARRDAPAF